MKSSSLTFTNRFITFLRLKIYSRISFKRRTFISCFEANNNLVWFWLVVVKQTNDDMWKQTDDNLRKYDSITSSSKKKHILDLGHIMA